MEKYKVNLIISTYAGKYNSENKENILKLNLKILNKLNPFIDKISIVKPKVNNNHEEILDYYNFENINLDNIKDKIRIIDYENIGISYGQFFVGIFNDLSYDYYILIEDDYVIFKNNFEKEFIEEFLKNENDSLLCSFIYKNKLWDIISYAEVIGEKHDNINLLKEILNRNNMSNIRCTIPDFSLSILSINTISKIINRYSNLGNIISIFNINFEKIWLHQILFGYILYASNIKIYDIVDSHINIFYHTINRTISLCNFEDYFVSWKEKIYNNEKLKSPLFIPIQILNNNNYLNDLNSMRIYMKDENDFFEKYNFLQI
jgi:hypothetical protein